MFRSRVFWKLYFVFVILILLTAATVGTLVSQRIEQDELRMTEKALRADAKLLSDLSGTSFENASLPILQERVRILSADLAVRLTVIRVDGVVLADSDENPIKMDNHVTRPELLAARANGVGTSTRFSNTVKTRMMYVAISVRKNNETVGYTRAALPLSTIDQRLAQVRNIAIFGAGFGVLIALIVGSLFARQFVKPLHEMTALANSIARGNYKQRVQGPVRAHDEFGQLAYALNTMATQVDHDITERERTEREKEQLIEQLRNAEARYHRIAANVPGMVHQCVMHPDQSIDFRFVSEGCREIYNLQPEEIMHDPALIIEIIVREDRASFHRSIAESAVTLLPWRWEGRVNLPSGEQKWIQGASRPERQADGSVVWDGLLVDITERKRAEEALRKSEEYHDLFRLASDAILIFLPEGEIVLDANDRACKVYGIAREDFIGRSLREMSKDVESGERHLEALLSNSTPSSIESTHFRADGTPINFLINLSLIEFQGQPAVLSINRDITEHRRVEESLRKSEEKLRQSQKMESIGTLAGGIAHDFNNILGAIIGYSELAQMDIGQDSPAQAHLEQVLIACARSRDLVKQILTFSRQEQHEREAVQLPPILAETIKLLRASLPSTIEIRRNIDSAAPSVLADPTMIQQVIINLCANAGQAMKARGGVLEICLTRLDVDAYFASAHTELKEGPHIRLTVSDTGCGMDRATQERIFDPFFTTKAPGEGTGLGLAVVHGVVKTLDGAITVYSELGVGTTFSVYLPAYDLHPGAAVHKSDPVPQGNGEHILFVDDEEALASLGKSMMEHLGYRVTTRANGGEALAAFRAQPGDFDLVITDQTMPEMNGAELGRALVQIRPELPVILTTGYSATISSEQAKALGIRELLFKPNTMRALGEAISRALDKSGKE